MAKTVLKKIFLVMLPALAVLLAASVDSVTVLDMKNSIAENYSYFDLVPVESLQICPPLAAILAAVSAALAVIFVVSGKNWSVATLTWIALASASMATIPYFVQGDMVVLPHAGLPLMMMAECALAYFTQKKPEPEQKRTISPKLRGK